jgi:hypothetical protein
MNITQTTNEANRMLTATADRETAQLKIDQAIDRKILLERQLAGVIEAIGAAVIGSPNFVSLAQTALDVRHQIGAVEIEITELEDQLMTDRERMAREEAAAAAAAAELAVKLEGMEAAVRAAIEAVNSGSDNLASALQTLAALRPDAATLAEYGVLTVKNLDTIAGSAFASAPGAKLPWLVDNGDTAIVMTRSAAKRPF